MRAKKAGGGPKQRGRARSGPAAGASAGRAGCGSPPALTAGGPARARKRGGSGAAGSARGAALGAAAGGAAACAARLRSPRAAGGTASTAPRSTATKRMGGRPAAALVARRRAESCTAPAGAPRAGCHANHTSTVAPGARRRGDPSVVQLKAPPLLPRLPALLASSSSVIAAAVGLATRRQALAAPPAARLPKSRQGAGKKGRRRRVGGGGGSRWAMGREAATGSHRCAACVGGREGQGACG